MLVWPDQQPSDCCGHVMLLHGAGAPVDSPWMNQSADLLSQSGWWVWRAEFDYMAQRRQGLPKRPPPRVAHLIQALDLIIQQHCAQYQTPLLLVGKSMGGRVATLWLAQTQVPKMVLGALVLGYPFHPLGRPEQPRTEHFPQLARPVDIIQGTRDPMGSMAWVKQQAFASNPNIIWLEGGNHDLEVGRRALVDNAPLREELIQQRANHWRTYCLETMRWDR